MSSLSTEKNSNFEHFLVYHKRHSFQKSTVLIFRLYQIKN